MLNRRSLVDMAPEENSKTRSIVEYGRDVIEIEIAGLLSLAGSLDERFSAAVELVLSTTGRVIISGMGKSGHVGRKIAATLASTGTPSFFIHPAEAAHGDLGMILPGDTVVLISNSGETQELLPVIQHVRRLGMPLVAISSGSASLLMRSATVALQLPAVTEACPVGIAPTTSTTMTLALGDALAMAVMQGRGFSREEFRQLHPGGKIGLRLMPVSAMMHGKDRLPLVSLDMPIDEVILEITARSFGVAGVVDADGRLLGTITDGDLRRNLGKMEGATAQTIMNNSPKTVDSDMIAEEALVVLNEYKITSLFVLNDEQVPIGLVHVHDFLRIGLSE